MNWNHGIRQFHRWVSIVFTLTVIANFVVMAQGTPPAWVTYSPLLPLALLLLTGLYLFVLPYYTKWLGRRRPVPPVRPADSSLTAQSLEISLTVAAVRPSAVWYRDTLGFIIEREFERDGRLLAVRLGADGIRILLTQDDGAKGTTRPKGEGFSFQITTSQPIDELATRAKQAGAVLDLEPTDAFGARVFRLRDPDGFRIAVSSPRET